MPAPKPKLKPQQIKFVENILDGQSYVDAYLNAGYKTKRPSAYVNASKLIHTDYIAEAIADRIKERQRRATSHLMKMSQMATSAYLDILNMDAGKNPKLWTLKFRVAQDIFDRMDVKGTDKLKIESDVNLNGQLTLKDIIEKSADYEYTPTD